MAAKKHQLIAQALLSPHQKPPAAQRLALPLRCFKLPGRVSSGRRSHIRGESRLVVSPSVSEVALLEVARRKGRI